MIALAGARLESPPLVVRIFCAKETSLFSMFNAFLDESGMEINVSIVIGGIMGTKEECDLAADRWNDALRNAVVKEPFHSIEFWNRSDGRMHGPFAHLSITDANLLAALLTDIIMTPPLRPLAIALGVRAFTHLTEDERRWLTTNKRFGRDWGSQGSPSNPYFFVFQACTQIVASATPIDDKAYFTFDRQDDFADRACCLYNELLAINNDLTKKMADELVFSSKSSAILLQAADFIAYLSRWYAEDRDSMPAIAAECFERMAKPEDSKIVLISPENLDAVLQQCPFRRTFWPEFKTRPDFVEQMRMNGYNVLAYKVGDTYLSHHIRPDKVRTIGKLQQTATADGNALFSVVTAQDEDQNG